MWTFCKDSRRTSSFANSSIVGTYQIIFKVWAYSATCLVSCFISCRSSLNLSSRAFKWWLNVVINASQTSHAVERPTTIRIASSVREESSRQRSHWSIAFHAKYFCVKCWGGFWFKARWWNHSSINIAQHVLTTRRGINWLYQRR